MGYRVINGMIYPVGKFPIDQIDKGKSNNELKTESKTGPSFNELLKKEIDKKSGFTISNHAAERLKDMDFNTADMKKINDAINKVKEKGGKNCLIVYKDVALVTSIENRTIITAVDADRAKENVFTNLDSVVLL
jgi:flagellar operon protein